MNKVDYNKEFHKVTDNLNGERPRLLLHACCAPCASSCLERVTEFFDTTVFFYNPNIMSAEEYRKRADELRRLIDIFVEKGHSVGLIEADYDPELFERIAKGYEDCPERGSRCLRCYDLRLGRAAAVAMQEKCDYFTTTLTLSPLKSAEALNEIGFRVAEELRYAGSDVVNLSRENLNGANPNIANMGERSLGNKTPIWLPSDFKKEDGYKRSIELSKEYGLYRQNYCGCVYSKRDASPA
ncbi:MAG: epoxyqueuosine reductase QueH [Lachnospiraceae bacterium]|nr:epoxyqueuosine reductase QueH [Lachnospiraceae bacterium]